MRQFNFSSKQLGMLKNNQPHQFAMRHAIHLYQSNAVFTFIPKNGCSTMRLSSALANGCIDDIEQGNWIHANNQTFNPSLKEAFCADYTFVILRCPYRRLASVFLNKFVSKGSEAWGYYNAMNRAVDLDSLTFTDFVKSLSKQPIKNSNIHWKPQVSFLLYKQYDDYFSLESFSTAISVLEEKIGLEVVDARSLTQHGTDRFNLVNGNYSEVSTFDILCMNRDGQSPSHEALFNEETKHLVQDLYREDIALYKAKCDETNLLF